MTSIPLDVGRENKEQTYLLLHARQWPQRGGGGRWHPGPGLAGVEADRQDVRPISISTLSVLIWISMQPDMRCGLTSTTPEPLNSPMTLYILHPSNRAAVCECAAGGAGRGLEGSGGCARSPLIPRILLPSYHFSLPAINKLVDPADR